MAEMLTAAAVEAIACVLDLDEQYEMAEAVRAQNARWRALVGELLGALREASAATPHQPPLRSQCPRCRWLILQAEAQAALDGGD